MESIIDRTLILQRPNMLLEKRTDVEVQVDLEIPITPINNDSETKMTKNDDNASASNDTEELVEVMEEQVSPNLCLLSIEYKIPILLLYCYWY